MPSDKAIPLSIDACANGTRTNQAAGAITRYAPRTVRSSSLVTPMTASARNARAAPTQPTDDVMCVVNVKRRTAGVNMFEGPSVAGHVGSTF